MLTQKKWAIVMVATATILGAGCGKKADDDEPATTSENLVLMQKLNMKCGTDSLCFGSSAATSLNLQNGGTALQTMQMFAWLSLGFPDTTAYKATLGDNPSKTLTDLVPMDGFVGNIESLRKAVVDAAKTSYPTLATCAAAPTSGTFKIGDNTATWKEPSLTAPSTFPSEKAGKKYDKALSYESSDGTVKGHFEFFCDYNGMTSTYTIYSGSTLQDRYILYYDRNDDTKLYVDFYLIDDSKNISQGTLELGVQLRSLGDGTMQTWVSRTGLDPDRGIQGYRYAVNSNLSTKKISFFILNDDTGYTQAQWDALSTLSSTAVTGGTAVSASGSSVDRLQNGCASNWDATSESMTTADLCTGLTLDTAPAPALDSTGNASLKWVRANLRTLIEALSN